MAPVIRTFLVFMVSVLRLVEVWRLLGLGGGGVGAVSHVGVRRSEKSKN